MCYLVYMTANPSPHHDPDAPCSVGIRDLRHKLSEYVKRAQAGETIVITDRGRQVARLVPEPVEPLGVIERGIADGSITPPSWWPGPRPAWPELRAEPPGSPTASEILSEMRDEEYR